jgi:hypothetical protein
VDEPAQGEFRPPYNLAFTTFWTFVEDLAGKPLPPRIDRSLMRSKSGSDQVSLTAAMKSFGLINANQEVTGLKELAATDKEGRLQWLALEVRRHYAAQLKVSAENGTEQQLKESFKETFGLESADTLRKTMTFFLHAARTARIETSAYFPTTRGGSGSPGTPKPRRPAKRKPAITPPKDENDEGGSLAIAGDVYTLTMRSGPELTFAVKMNVMEASVEDRNFVFAIIDKLRGYSKPAKASGSAKDAGGQKPEPTEVSP